MRHAAAGRVFVSVTPVCMAMQEDVSSVIALLGHPLSTYPNFSFGTFTNRTEEAEHFLEELHRSDWATASPRNRLLVQALDFGVALHHAGVGIKYRRAAEVLFRAGKVRVLFATGTLAQGLNMPARTVAFDGNCELINPMTYQQMAGRAGRRGFDVAGRIVFCRFSPQRIAALTCATIPPARGTLTLSAPTTLRVLGGTLSQRDLAALLTQPLARLGAPQAAVPQPTEVPLRQAAFLFSAALLQHRGLLDEQFKPTGLQHLVARMHYQPFSAVLFLVDLLETGVLALALRAVPHAARPLRLLEILACMWIRMPVRPHTAHVARSDVLGAVLTPLRQLSCGVHAALCLANELTLRMLAAHLRDAAIAASGGSAAAAQRRQPALPFSGLALKVWGGAVAPRAGQERTEEGRPHSTHTVVRSPFSARYRLGDDFESAQELEEAAESSLQVGSPPPMT